MNEQFDPRELRHLSAAERQDLLRALVDIERASDPHPGTSWKWEALLVLIVASCVGLAVWIGYLTVVLPSYYRTGSWRGAWVGFDIGLLALFAITGWAAWRRRQVLIISLLVLATLLICDAWFDVVLDVGRSGFWFSLISALAFELPLAVLAILMARRLLRLTISQVMRYEGLRASPPPLWRIPLLGPGTGTPLRRMMTARAQVKTASTAAELPDPQPTD